MTRTKKTTVSGTKKEKPDLQPSEDAGAIQPAAASASETGSVDKIRDLIFGNQMQEYDQRFARLEQRIFQEVRDLRDETSRRLDTMEAYLHKEIDSLSDRINTEQKLRAESLEKVTQEFGVSVKAVSESIERLVGKQSEDSRDLRQQLLEQSKFFTDEINNRHKESSAALDQSVQELRTEKMDRSALSELFMELAVRMSEELSAKLNLESDDKK